ncbi:helix-turn-helix domain-containing protein [Variovorax sp. J22G73]|uniref:helix-turn-helix domain-containing protein n=1 Tax=unclassified Variovorax TaxID=663243 RepID=UPI00257569B6|nr:MULTISPECIES: helix-turn-helix domain-containing protein [unclassified Variovorax]MDM0007481.1 helix-turn-helix domain-containing protein [Variovorax sp. J22R203]MDM0100159.1 helix-turn-helix domain-containing protein [Variovorax sp. J22G73]
MTKFERMPAYSPAVFAGIAEEIEDAITARSRERLDQLQERLGDEFMEMLRAAPDAVVAAVHGTAHPDAPELIAYMLGKISFSQAVVAQAAERRADDCYVDILHANRFKAYVRALEHEDLSGVQLAQATGDRPETVSRKLKELRDAGIVEFRREGTRIINFLTPSAQAAFHSEMSTAQGALDIVIQKRAEQLDPHMRQAKNFAPYDAVTAFDV